MNVEKEILEIKERLDRIEAFLSKAFPPAESTHQGRESSYELLDLKIKKSQGDIGPEYAYRLTVRNSSNNKLCFGGKIIFLDSSEFEVESQPIGMFTVPAGETFTKTGIATVIDKNHAPRIADVTAEIYPL